MTVQPGCGDTGDSGVDGYFHACDAPGSIGPRNGIFVLLGQIGVGLMILESGMHPWTAAATGRSFYYYVYYNIA
jgi:hypothetical protein